jgi:hypothetical protein
MYEKLTELYPDGTCNRTDLIVRHDSKYSGGTVVKAWSPVNGQDENFRQSEVQVQDNTKIDGIKAPIIKVNNRVIDFGSIIYFDLKNIGIFPEIELTIYDDAGMINFGDTPGLNNVISVIMIPPVEGSYKKISLDFYITEYNNTGEIVTYKGIFKCMPLDETQLKQVKFHHPSEGCKEKWCQLAANDAPSTYEFFHVIAEETGLGLAATQHVKEISDNRYRILSSQTYREAIKQHLEFSGLDETSMFDAWVDLYGYICIANVYWLLVEESVKANELASTAITGIPTSQDSVADQKTVLCHRTIYNFDQNSTPSNLEIKSYTQLSDPGTNALTGTANHYNFMNAQGAQGSNEIKNYDIQQQELSTSGEDTSQYSFQKTKFLGVEMADKNPILKQKTLRDKYFEKIRSKVLLVKLRYTNFGLQRGMLTNVIINETDYRKQSKILSQMGTEYKGAQDSDTIPEEQIEVMKENIGNQDTYVLNTALSGIYYIDGVEFKYDDDSQQIEQQLYLIKKGNIVDWDSSTATLKVNTDNTTDGVQ